MSPCLRSTAPALLWAVLVWGVSQTRWCPSFPRIVTVSKHWRKMCDVVIWQVCGCCTVKSLDLDAETTNLELAENTSVGDLPSKVPTDRARYHFFTFRHTHEGCQLNTIGNKLIYSQWELCLVSLHFNGHFPGEPGLAGVYWSIRWWRWWWQLGYWSYKLCKVPVKSSSTNQTSSCLQAGCSSCRPTNNFKALKGNIFKIELYIVWQMHCWIVCYFL